MSGTVHAGITGNVGIVFKLAEGADPAVEYDGDLKNVRITSTDKDDSDLTFAEAATGETKDHTVTVTANQSTAAGSLWKLLWENPAGEFSCTYGPHGNAIATADKPHFTMTLKADGRPEIGVEARRGKERGTFDYTFQVTAGPVLDDGTP